jgi:hypothetical protein
MDDYSRSVMDYLKHLSKQPDGIVWIVCSALAITTAILLNVDLLPWTLQKTGKRTVVLLFTPLLLFLALVNLRLLPFSNAKFASSLRGCLIFGAFVILNF